MEIRLLGEVGALVGGAPVDVGSARQRCVLAALAVDAGRVVSVERLVERVWGGTPPARARATLINYLSRLRVATDLVIRGAGGYALGVDRLAVDLHRFRELRARARATADDGQVAALLDEALGLWRGEALTGLDGEWAAAARVRLHEERLAAECDLADARLRLGRGDDLVAELSERAASWPLDERVAGQHMLALHQAGRTADALRRYHDFRQRLVDELGGEPGEALRDLHRRLLVADPIRPLPERPSCLPYRVPDFTGRGPELGVVLEALRGGAVVLLHGMAGVGKTALAVDAVHRAAPRFPDGRLFVDLHGHSAARDPLTPGAALSALLSQLGVPSAQHPDDVDELAALWRARTAGRDLVVLLDNAAHADQVRPLLPGSGSVAVLVTSRRRLTALDGVHPVHVDVLPDADASALFAAVAGRPDAGVAALCGGLPLAVRIAAARLRHRPGWTAAELADRLRAQRAGLGELRTTDSDITAAFALSYRELPAPQRRLFRLLGLHPGPLVTLGAAAAMAAAAPSAVEPLLDDLVDAHLLDHTGNGYALHALLARHSRGLCGPDEAASALDRLRDYYRDGGDNAWRTADHLRSRGHRDEFLTGAEAARRLAEPHAILRGLGVLASAHWESGNLDAAIATTRSHPRLVEGTDAWACASRHGTFQGTRGDHAAAVSCYRQALAEETDDNAVLALALRDRAGDEEGVVRSAAQPAMVLARVGRVGEADRAAVDAALGLDHPFGEGWARLDHAGVLPAGGRPADLAPPQCEVALAAARRIDFRARWTRAHRGRDHALAMLARPPPGGG